MNKETLSATATQASDQAESDWIKELEKALVALALTLPTELPDEPGRLWLNGKAFTIS